MTLTEETLRFITAHRHDDVRSLALQAGKHPLVDMPAALTQIAGRQTAESKIPTWAATEGILYPPHLSMEQCSSEVTARYKASVVVGHEGLHNTLADLTGGFGIDFSFLAPHFRTSYLCRTARGTVRSGPTQLSPTRIGTHPHRAGRRRGLPATDATRGLALP